MFSPRRDIITLNLPQATLKFVTFREATPAKPKVAALHSSFPPQDDHEYAPPTLDDLAELVAGRDLNPRSGACRIMSLTISGSPLIISFKAVVAGAGFEPATFRL
jgi:hypothetical protein